MKRFLSIFIFTLCLLTSTVQAKTIKVVSLEHFSTEFPSTVYNVQIIQTEAIGNGIFLEAGTIVSGYVVKVYKPRWGKRDGYFEFQPILITYNGKTTDIHNSKIVAKVIGRKRINPQELAGSVAIKAANFVLLGSSQVISFTLGANSAEDGEKIKAGLERMYKDSFISYIEAGKELDIDTGDILILKLKRLK